MLALVKGEAIPRRSYWPAGFDRRIHYVGSDNFDCRRVFGHTAGSGLISPAAGSLIRATVVLTNGFNGMSIIPELIGQSIPGPHPVFAWLGYPVFRG
jgi:hypothetical protein